MKKSVLASAIVMALSVSAAYAGSIITINPDGTNPTDPNQLVGSLGWNDGNALSINATGLTPGDAGSRLIQTYAHARLANFNDGGGNPIGGLNLNAPGANGYEWTYVTGFQEVVASATPGAPFNTATFQVTSGGTNFFQIWYDPSRNSANLTGQGFNNGTLILSGTVRPFDLTTGEGASAFTATGLGGNLDQFGANNYPGITTVAGIGTSNLVVDVASWNTDFFNFLPGSHELSLKLNFDTFQNLPYQQQNPSACFWNGSAFVNGAGGQGTACVNSVGAINGISGPNFMFQTRSSNDFVSVPEPASLALLGAGLIGLGLARRRKNQA